MFEQEALQTMAAEFCMLRGSSGKDKMIIQAGPNIALSRCLALSFGKAWCEEEAKLQRALISFVLRRSRKSLGTRLGNLAVL